MNLVAPTAVTHGLDAGHDGQSVSPGTGGGGGAGPGPGPGAGGSAPLSLLRSGANPVAFSKPVHSAWWKSPPRVNVQYRRPDDTASAQQPRAKQLLRLLRTHGGLAQH